MKKIFVVLLTFMICILVYGCNYDLYHGKRPFDYDDAKWICQTPYMWFEVDSEPNNFERLNGEVLLDTKTYSIKLTFVNQTNTMLLTSNLKYQTVIGNEEYAGLDGKCEFFSDKLIVKINKGSDTLFNGEYEELIFKPEYNNG